MVVHWSFFCCVLFICIYMCVLCLLVFVVVVWCGLLFAVCWLVCRCLPFVVGLLVVVWWLGVAFVC